MEKWHLQGISVEQSWSSLANVKGKEIFEIVLITRNDGVFPPSPSFSFIFPILLDPNSKQP